jgi:hypothetical protein
VTDVAVQHAITEARSVLAPEHEAVGPGLQPYGLALALAAGAKRAVSDGTNEPVHAPWTVVVALHYFSR